MVARLRAAAVLALCAFSLALFAFEMSDSWLFGLIKDNTLSPVLRKSLLFQSGLAAGVVGVAAFAFMHVSSYRAELAIQRAARLSCPLSLAAVMPALLIKEAWEPLAAGAAIGAFTIIFERLMVVSLRAFEEIRGGESADSYATRHRSERVTRVIVLASAAFYAFYMSRYTVFAHRRFQTYNFDLGQYDNVFWNALHGRPLHCTPLGAFTDWSSLASHADLGVYFLLPFYALRPQAETLLILQSCILGLGAVPLYFFAVKRLPPAHACALALAYLLFPPMHGANFYDFHFQPIAATLVLFTIWFVDARRWIALSVVFIMALSCREDISVGLAMLGLYLVFSGHRPRAGALMAVSAAAYFVVIRFVIMQRFGPGWFADIYKDLYPKPNGPNSYGGVMLTLATNPAYVFRTLLTEDKLRYLLQILGPVAFLPLRRTYLLPALAPGALFTLLTTGYGPTTDIGFQYSGHYTPYLFAASALVLSSYRSSGGGGVRLTAATAALCVATLFATSFWGAFPAHGIVRGGFNTVGFSAPTVADAQKERDLAELARMIPEGQSFAVSEEELPHVSGRLNVLTLKYGAGAAAYLLYGVNSYGASVGVKALADGEYVELATRPGLVLLQRKDLAAVH